MKETNFSTIEEMTTKKSHWVDETKELKNFEGIKDTLTKLYTSSGHFIFELLQNAEDVGATNVSFTLYDDKLVFEHDGTRLFDIADIDSITNIGDSTKKDEGNTIGKFGIGFKSVFEYTATPQIHSGTYHFQIEDLFVPKIIEKIDNFDDTKTVIVLPFNGDKDSNKCYEEIEKSLHDLSSLTLLFLQHIKEINCCFKGVEIKLSIDSFSDSNCPANIWRVRKTENGVLTTGNGGLFKRFFKSVIVPDENNINKEITIGLAFMVRRLKDSDAWKIEPIVNRNFSTSSAPKSIPNGKIFAYFPCAAEPSKFCFHIHAPFALTVDREKLREDDANKIVIGEIGNLVCESIEELMKDGLVDMELYKTLPNPKDDNDLGKFNDIGLKILNCFKNNPYILMADNTYSSVKDKLMGPEMQRLLNDDDLSLLKGTVQKKFWVKCPLLNSREYNFLESTGVRLYRIEDFTHDMLISKDRGTTYAEIIALFEKREIEWFAKLYSQMSMRWEHIKKIASDSYVRSLSLCLCEDGKIRQFNECFLVDDNFNLREIDSFNKRYVNYDCVNTNRFTETDLVSFFTKKLLVGKYSKSDSAKLICESIENDCSNINKDYFQSLKILISLMSNDDGAVREIVGKYKILCSEDGNWDVPCYFYLPEEFGGKVKNISIYYDFFNSIEKRGIHKLSPEYRELFDNEDELRKFKITLFSLGVKSSLPIYESHCSKNPHWRKIIEDAPQGVRGKANPTDEDFEIPRFKEFLERTPNEAMFELVWSFLSVIPYNRYFKCKYSPAAKYEAKFYPSHIVLDLAKSAWVLQDCNGDEKYVKPQDASFGCVPLKFRGYINSNLRSWCSAMQFGAKERQKNEQQKKEDEFLRAMGLDPDKVRMLKRLEEKGVDIGKVLSEADENSIPNIIDDDDFDSDLWSEKSLEKYADASAKEYAEKLRSVRVGLSEIKAKSREYLRGRYMDQQGNMACQICKNPMPFKGLDGNAWFSNVQLFNTRLVPRNCEYNYLALCPVCAAKMKVYFNKEEQEKLYKKMDVLDTASVFKIQLDKEESISFSLKHITSLRAIVKKERESQETETE